ncbi:MAG: hypothetical protein WC389_12855 [Lutibacter sp.]|jgi:hypothetical protein
MKNVKGTITQTQKSKALKEFNLGEKSECWNKEKGLFNFAAVAKLCGVSDYTTRDWYARWTVDKNTKLDDLKPLPKEVEEDRKWKYFEDIAAENPIADFDASVKYQVNIAKIKTWRCEYLKNGGKINEAFWKSKQKRHTITQPQVEVKKEPQVNVNNGHKDDIAVLDSFFDGVVALKEKIKKLECDVDFYKGKCQKWSAQVIELQSALVLKN